MFCVSALFLCLSVPYSMCFDEQAEVPFEEMNKLSNRISPRGYPFVFKNEGSVLVFWCVCVCVCVCLFLHVSVCVCMFVC